jgi:hypothetical protein
MSPRERRVVVGGATVIVVALLAFRVVPAWLAWLEDTRAVARVSIAELDRTQSGIAGMPSIRDSLVARNDRYLELAPSILSGTRHGAVGAALASLVSGSATSAGLELGAVSIRLDTARTNAFSRPSVRGDARGDVAGLTRFLAALERGPTIVVIRQLAVTQPEPGAGNDRAEGLRIEFTVEGIALVRGTTETASADRSARSMRPLRAPEDAP